MNNQKTLWKTGHFKWIRILLCIVPLFVPNYAQRKNHTDQIPYDEINARIFENDNYQYVESVIMKSMETTKNVLALPEIENEILWAPAANIIFILDALLAYETYWKESFSRTIVNEVERGIALGHVQMMKAAMDTINTKFDLLKEDHPKRLRTSVARYIHRECDKMLSLFAASDSFVKKYPLIGTPLLIALAQLVALFNPIAKALIKNEAKNPDLACKARNILIDYRPRTVNARLEKLHDYSKTGTMLYRNDLGLVLQQVMALEYNQYGYNKTTPASVNNCQGCAGLECLIDDFGENYNLICRDYILFLRHRVEELFPVDLVDSSCVDKPQTTGFGWLTIKFREVAGRKLWDNNRCELFSSCDPFIRLTIDGKQVFQTNSRTNTDVYDVDTTYTSPKITKKSWIKVEMFDDDYSGEELILRAEGNVDTFLKNGFISVAVTMKLPFRIVGVVNFIDSVSFWQDEYDYKNK